MTLSEKLNANKNLNSDKPGYVPEQLQTISTKEIKSIENTHFKVKIMLNVDLALDETLVDKQKELRRNNGKKVSKEDIILEILKSHFKIKN